MARRPPAITDKQAQAWRMRYDEGLRYREIGERMGVTKETAIKHVQIAETKLGDRKLPELKGLSPGALVARNAAAIDAAIADLSPEETGRKARVVRAHALTFLSDPNVLAKSNATQLAKVVVDMTQVDQLVRGEPTQIVKIQDVRKLEEVGKLLHAELERRGMIVEGEAKEVDDG